MRGLLQRVSTASVTIEGTVKHEIQQGLLLLVGIEEGDLEEDLVWFCGKVLRMRIFGDEAGKMNRSLLDVKGELLVISQFTLHASTKKGNRPSFINAARPELAIPLYEKCLELFEQELSGKVGSGEFGANMQVQLINDGPVTIWLDSKNKE